MFSRSKTQSRVPDRRRRTRIVTLKNFRNTMFVLIGLFAVISVYFELRPQDSGDYGRLFARNVPAQDVEVKAPEVVTEATPVHDAVSPDPFSVQAGAREQLLRPDLQPLPTATTIDPADPATTTALRRSEAARIQIVGGSEGVSVVQTDGLNVPVLAGGFGRRK